MMDLNSIPNADKKIWAVWFDGTKIEANLNLKDALDTAKAKLEDNWWIDVDNHDGETDPDKQIKWDKDQLLKLLNVTPDVF